MLEKLVRNTFCLYPFVNLNSNTEGSVKLCCSINENLHVKDSNNSELNFGTHSVEEIWNSEYMQDVRNKMLNGERPDACNVCWRLEDMGIQSSRQSAWAEFKHTKYDMNLIKTVNPPLPSSLELRLGNFCNLRCNSCWSLSSDRIRDERHKIVDKNKNLDPWLKNEWTSEISLADNQNWLWWESDEFLETTKKLAPTLRRLYLTGGEPTLIKKNIEIMQYILDSGNTSCYIALTTNMTNYNEKFFDVMSQFDHGELQISIDDVFDRNQYIRYPTNWKHVEDNIVKLYYKFPKSWIIKHYTVFQVYNYDSIPNIIDWIRLHRSYHDHEKERTYIWSPIILENPKYLDARILPKWNRNHAIDQLHKYLDENVETDSTYWKHGITQIIKFLGNDFHDDDHASNLRTKFMYYNDVLDKHRNTNWRSTFSTLYKHVFKMDEQQ